MDTTAVTIDGERWVVHRDAHDVYVHRDAHDVYVVLPPRNQDIGHERIIGTHPVVDGKTVLRYEIKLPAELLSHIGRGNEHDQRPGR